MRVTPGTHKNSSEAGDVSRGRLGDVVEAEAGLSTHRAVMVILTLVEELVLDSTKL